MFTSEECIVPVSKPSAESQSAGRGGVIDLIAFLAVLVVGWILIAQVHVGPATLTAYGTAAAGLFVAWRRR